MSVESRGKIPEAIFMVVATEPHGLRVRLYHSYTHAWKIKEKLSGRLFKVETAGMTEVRA